MKTHEEGQSGALALDAWLGVRLYVEHGWLCIRTETGWLLWSKKCSDIDNTKGTDFAAVLTEAAQAYTEWKNDPARKEEEADDEARFA